MELVGVLFQMPMLPGIKNSRVNTNAVRVAAYILADLEVDTRAKEMVSLVAEKIDERAGVMQANASRVVEMAVDVTAEATTALQQIHTCIYNSGQCRSQCSHDV